MKEAHEIKHGMTLGDGFVVESVYMALGSVPRHYFATGWAYGVRLTLSKRHLGVWSSKVTVKG